MRTPPLMLGAAALLMTTSSLTGQQAEGSLMAAPVGYGLVPGTPVATPPFVTGANAIQRKAAGFVFAEEVPAFEPTVPVQWSLLPFVGQPFEVDAFSTGLDTVNATRPEGGESVIDFSISMAWSTTLFTVESGSPAVPGSIVDAQLGAPTGNGADLFSANLPGSDFVSAIDDCYPTDTAQLAIEAAAMGIIPNPGAEMRWVDLFLPLYSAGQTALDLLPTNPTVYFSVRADDALLVPPAWFGATPPSGATILKTTWVGGWTRPVPHLTFAQLGLGLFDEVDALAVDEANCKALFSIGAKTGLIGEQLQIVEWNCTDSVAGYAGDGMEVTVGEYNQSVGGESVGRSMGLDDGSEIDGVCIKDPGGQVVDTCDAFVGWPVGKSGANKELSFQTYRDVTTPGVGTLTFVIDGATTAAPGQQLQVWGLVQGLAPLLVHIEPAAGPARRTISLPNAALDGPVTTSGVCIGFTVIAVPAPKIGAPIVELRIF